MASMMSLAVAAFLQASIVAADGPTYAAAYKQMTTTGCPLVVLIGADWCPACQTMKTSVIPELQRTGKLDQVAFAVVDYDQETTVARKLMQGNSIPQLVIYHKSADGWRRQRLVGRQSVETVAALVKQGVDAVAALPAKPTVPASATQDQ
jgi:thioredoxin-like negative regulator of GroEL